MPQNESSILILKPTPHFISLIASQIPEAELPEFDLLQTDNTAYSIRKCETEEAVLDEIEHFFPLMFEHESSRLIGEKLSGRISGTFLDFLCCFKFELHTEVMLLESCIDNGHQVLCVKPRSVVLNWLKTPQEDQINISDLLEDTIDMSHFTENTTVLVKNFDNLSQITPFIKHNYQPIVQAEMVRLSDEAEYCPVVNSFKIFSRYFDVEMHSHLVHLH
ncbi:MAG: hypothetical protein Q8R83_03845 [Legionellaceae bacterium]|nr:hypothetical protein [Legionellaceae bacterium]